MSTLSRRLFLTGAAAVPAIAAPAAIAAVAALPAVAEPAPIVKAPIASTVQSTAPDPIFAAIEEERRLHWQSSSLDDQLEDAEHKLLVQGDPCPNGLIEWRNHDIDAYGIKQLRKQLLREGRISRKKIEAEFKNATARRRQALRDQRNWYKRHGLTELKTEAARLSKEYDAAWDALAEIRPTTTAGAAALIAHVRAQMELVDDGMLSAIMANAVRALTAMPNDALPAWENARPDLDLINAADNQIKGSLALDRLYDKHGDAADSRDDYAAIEKHEMRAIRTLHSKRARTSNGIIAKATAVKRLTPYQPHAEMVAASLAKDVLRYFGSATAV